MIETLNWLADHPWSSLWIGFVLMGIAHGLGRIGSTHIHNGYEAEDAND